MACSVSLARLSQVLSQTFAERLAWQLSLRLGAVAALVLYMSCHVECLALPSNLSDRYVKLADSANGGTNERANEDHFVKLLIEFHRFRS